MNSALTFYLTTKKMNKDGLYAFYGTLRSGMENNLYYGTDALVSQGVCWLNGFLLYSLGEYPYAVRCDDATKHIKVEVFHIADHALARTIHDMELAVGYYYDEIQANDVLAGIYLFRNPSEGDILIEHGDWVKFKGSDVGF